MGNKHALVFIHGMGEQKDGWHQPALDVLNNAFPTYSTFKKQQFADRILPIPILYSDLFTALRDQWKNDVGVIKAVLGQQLEAVDTAQRQGINSEFDSIANAIGAGADTFVWTHAMDVVLYRFFSLVRQHVNIRVANQLLQAATSDSTEWSVIAHSLGTAVAHNSLNTLYTDSQLNPNGTVLQPKQSRPKMLAMVANVSRVLQLPALKVFSSLVMPGDVSLRRACNTYLNVRHVFDPFTFPQPFEPDNTWPTPGTFSPTQYQHIRPSHLVLDQLINVHDLDHYLKNPRVHVPIFRAMFGDDTILDDELAAKSTAFDESQQSANVDAVRHALEPLIPPKTAEWIALLQSLFDLTGLRKP